LFAFAGSAIQLVPDGTILFHLLLIIVMVSLLNATLLKPVNRILAEREKRTKGGSDEAQTTLATANEKLRSYQDSLREARTAGYSLLDQERADASRQRELKIAAVKTEVESMIAREKETLGVSQDQAKLGLRSSAEALALEIGRRVLGRDVSR
jgi:F-type H+-transporting ATPase subunit b